MTDEHQARSRAASALCWTVVILSLAIYGSRLRGVFQTTCSFDDAYMFIRYANNLLGGYGVAWNPGEGQVFGVTSLLHLFAVALARWTLPLRDSTILSGLSAVASVGAAFTLVFVSSRAARGLRRQPLTWAALILPPLVLQETFMFHALSGMDTMLSVLCNALLIGGVLRYLEAPGWPRMSALLAMAYLTILARPDNGIYATLFPALAIALLGPSETRVAGLRRFVVGILAILIADAAVKYAVFGDFVPLGFFAKQAGHYARFAATAASNPLKRIIPFFTASAPFLAVLVLCARRRDAALVASFLIPAALTVAYYTTVVQVMGLSARFYYPSIPFLLVCAALLLDRRFDETGGALPRSGLVVRVIAALALIYVGPVVLDRGARLFADRFIESLETSQAGLYRSDATTVLPSLGWWSSINDVAKILEAAPAGSSIALSEHGMVGAAAPHAILVDVLGLHDRAFAHHGFSAGTLLAREPDMLWGPHSNYVGIVEGILCEPSFWEQYDYYPQAFDYGVALRRSSPRFEVLRDLVQAQWRRSYGTLNMASYRATPLLESDRCKTVRSTDARHALFPGTR